MISFHSEIWNLFWRLNKYKFGKFELISIFEMWNCFEAWQNLHIFFKHDLISSWTHFEAWQNLYLASEKCNSSWNVVNLFSAFSNSQIPLLGMHWRPNKVIKGREPLKLQLRHFQSSYQTPDAQPSNQGQTCKDTNTK